MKTSNRSLLVGCALGIATTILGIDAAEAGPNAGGILILHAAGGECSADVIHCDCESLERCGDAIVEAHGPVSSPAPFLVMMVFPEGASPRVSSARFGLEYDQFAVFLPIEGACGEAVSTPDWPDSGSGTVVTFETPRTRTIEMIYYFAGYEYYGLRRQLQLTPHPDLGGFFEDDSVPPLEDEIVDYGAIGFNMEGRLPCEPASIPDSDPSVGSLRVWPNPSTGSVEIVLADNFDATDLDAAVFGIDGRRLATLARGAQTGSMSWDGQVNGTTAPNGSYIVVLRRGDTVVATERFVLAR